MGPATSLVLFILLAVFESQARFSSATGWSIVLLIIAVGIPVGYFLSSIRQGKVSDLDLSERLERGPIFAITILSWVAALLVTLIFDLPDLVRASFTAGIVVGLIFLGVTQRWKISVHSGMWTSLVLLLWLLFGGGWLWGLVGLLPIGWARLTLKKHNLLQLLAGVVIAGGVLILVFGWFELLPTHWL